MIISYKVRSLPKETPFWSAFGLWFKFVPVLARSRRFGDSSSVTPEESYTRFSPGDPADEMFVFVATRRPESLAWLIPEDDTSLLGGVGACGSASRKWDDQFEQLLLMGMDVY